MKIVIFGANGKVGRQVVELALQKNLQVVAITHGQNNLPPHPNLEIRQGDIYDKSSVASAIRGTDGVISTLGSWGTKRKDVLSKGMKHIIPAMQKHGVTRIISLTGHDARAKNDKLNLTHRLTHPVLQIIAPKILNDGELHITLLEKSDLAWTVLRSPTMNEKGDPKLYKLTSKRPMPWETIHRTSVAVALVEAYLSDQHHRQAPYLSRR